MWLQKHDTFLNIPKKIFNISLKSAPNQVNQVYLLAALMKKNNSKDDSKKSRDTLDYISVGKELKSEIVDAAYFTC